MSRQVQHDVLRRMVSPPPPAPEDVPVTSSRAVRMAVTRAADKTHALPLTVLGLREEVASLEDMLAMPAASDMLIALNGQEVMVGLAGLDQHLYAALGEVQTVGHVLNAAPEDRPATATDSALSAPLLAAIFQHLAETAQRTPLDGWQGDAAIGQRIANVRAAGLILPEAAYRVIRMTIDLHVDGREGTLMLALPDHLAPATPKPAARDDTGWDTRFRAVVNAAPVQLAAELCRFKIPLSVANALAVDQVLPLVGCKVTSVKLRAKDGRRVATARLGQAGGMRAIRIETPPADEMRDLDGPAGAADMMGMVGSDMDSFAAPDPDLDPPADQAMPFGMGDIAGADGAGPPDSDLPADDDSLNAALSVDFDTPTESVTLGGNGDDELAWNLEDETGDSATPAPLDWSAEGFDIEGEE